MQGKWRAHPTALVMQCFFTHAYSSRGCTDLVVHVHMAHACAHACVRACMECMHARVRAYTGTRQSSLFNDALAAGPTIPHPHSSVFTTAGVLSLLCFSYAREGGSLLINIELAWHCPSVIPALSNPESISDLQHNKPVGSSSLVIPFDFYALTVDCFLVRFCLGKNIFKPPKFSTGTRKQGHSTFLNFPFFGDKCGIRENASAFPFAFSYFSFL